MNALDQMLPQEGPACLEMARSFMSAEVAPVMLDADDPAGGPLPAASRADLDGLGLTDILTVVDLGTERERLALLLATGRDMARTDAGLAMATVTAALTSRAAGSQAGFGVVVERPDGRGAAVVTGDYPCVVVWEEPDRACVHDISSARRGPDLPGLRLGGAYMLGQDALGGPGQVLCPTVAATLRQDLGHAALAVAMGTAAGSLQTATAYAEVRFQGGTTIARHHAVRKMLVSMSDHIVHADVLLTHLLTCDDPSRHLLISAFDACEEAVSHGVQVLGGYGYMQEYGQDKRMRDLKTLRLLFCSAGCRS